MDSETAHTKLEIVAVPTEEFFARLASLGMNGPVVEVLREAAAEGLVPFGGVVQEVSEAEREPFRQQEL